MTLNDVLINVLYVIVTGCATALTTWLCAYISKKTKELTNNKYITGAMDAVSTAVSSVMQTYVDGIKRDGEFSIQAQKEAKEMAKQIAINLITVDGKQAITDLYGDFAEWLEHEIEYEVKAQK